MGVGMLGVFEYIARSAGHDDFTEVHDEDVVAVLGHDA